MVTSSAQALSSSGIIEGTVNGLDLEKNEGRPWRGDMNHNAYPGNYADELAAEVFKRNESMGID
jgi:hypothetical protein